LAAHSCFRAATTPGLTDHAGLHNGIGAKAARAQYQGVEFKLRAPQTPGAYPVSLRWNMHYTYDQAIEGVTPGRAVSMSKAMGTA
jgi:hypothetical protein